MESVWGIVVQIEELELGLLDSHEDYNPNVAPSGNSYIRKELRVLRDGNGQTPLTVCTYVGNPQSATYKPNKEYKDQIVKGAIFWHLPEDYIRQLEIIETSN